MKSLSEQIEWMMCGPGDERAAAKKAVAALEAENARLRKVYEAADNWERMEEGTDGGRFSFARRSARNFLIRTVREARDGS